MIHDNDMSIYSDLYKDAFGVRPRSEDNWDYVRSMSQSEFHAELSRLEAISMESTREAIRNAESLCDLISQIARNYNVSVQTACRWLMDAHATDDMDEFAWQFGALEGSHVLKTFLGE